jgi:hypothetical protein
MIEPFLEAIERRELVIAVIGLGYVGLPVACMFADAGFRVVGIERSAEKVDLINRGVSPIEGEEPGLAEMLAGAVRNGKLRATSDYAACREARAISISVETPVGDDNRPPCAPPWLRSAQTWRGGRWSSSSPPSRRGRCSAWSRRPWRPPPACGQPRTSTWCTARSG